MGILGSYLILSFLAFTNVQKRVWVGNKVILATAAVGSVVYPALSSVE